MLLCWIQHFHPWFPDPHKEKAPAPERTQTHLDENIKKPLTIPSKDEEKTCIIFFLPCAWWFSCMLVVFFTFYYPLIQSSKKLEIHHILRVSSSHNLLARGHFLLVLVNDFVSGWLALTLPAGQVSLKVSCRKKNLLVLDYQTGLFLSPVDWNKGLLDV